MIKNIASFILLVVLCVSCGKHDYPSALVEADSLCYSNPKLHWRNSPKSEKI